MKYLPVEHKSAQYIYDALTKKQLEQFANYQVGDLENRIHIIEVLYDMKQQIAVELIKLEKSLSKLTREFDEFCNDEGI